MNSVTQWLQEYGVSHRNPVNKLIHRICVPVIVFSLLGLLWLVPFPDIHYSVFKLNICSLFLLLSLAYYFYLSACLAIGMLIYCAIMYVALYWLAGSTDHLLQIYTALFIIAWIGQFIGHSIEGKRPSFFRDIQFLMIGPLWLLSAVYRKLNIRY